VQHQKYYDHKGKKSCDEVDFIKNVKICCSKDTVNRIKIQELGRRGRTSH
jgi:hypothetical protein